MPHDLENTLSCEKPPNHIMFVDDEPRLLSAMRRNLSDSYDVLTFETGAEAIEHLSKPHAVALVIADMQMPEMNGIELLKNIQRIAPNVRRLMLTGNSDQETAIAAINEGKVFRFIRKPCQASEMKTIIDQALHDYYFSIGNLKSFETPKVQPITKPNFQTMFLPVMGEELRTPLNQIITISEALNRSDKTYDPESFSKLISQIHNRGIFALSQVERLLQFARLKLDIKDGASDSCDVVGILHQELVEFEAIKNEKLITVSLESLRKTALIATQYQVVEMVVRELLSNAFKSSPIGGHIGIIVKCESDRIAIRITNESTKDTSPTKSDVVETDLSLMGASPKQFPRGIGIGLSIVRIIADKLNYFFNIEKLSGGGTAVVFIGDRDVSAETQDMRDEVCIAS